MVLNVSIGTFLFCLLAMVSPGSAEAAEGTSLTELVEQLHIATRDSQEAKRNSVIEQLREEGTNALPVIYEAMKTADVPLRMNLVHVVRRMHADESTEALLRIALEDPSPEVSRMAVTCIDNRIIRRPLTLSEWATVTERIRTRTSAEAKVWAYILAHSGIITDPQVVEAILRRFLEDVKDPSLDVSGPHLGSYILGKAQALNSYLRAFYFMDSALAIPALKRAFATTTDESTRKWLTIALGMAGDESQSWALLDIVENTDDDSSIRAEALRAYARAAKAQAIPVLEGFLADRTPGPDPVRPPLAVVARSELYWLRNPEKRQEALGK
jgi:HEAT repeat protein